MKKYVLIKFAQQGFELSLSATKIFLHNSSSAFLRHLLDPGCLPEVEDRAGNRGSALEDQPGLPPGR